MKFFNNIETAFFIERPNRYKVLCNLNGRVTAAYLPNPGRLNELLLPGIKMYLEKRVNPSEGQMEYTAVAVERDGEPVILHTHKSNDVAEFLLNNGLIPGMEDVKVLKREVKSGGSRFDFLLLRNGERVFLEVKSCTLFGKRVAMFPDAVTARGRRHIEELAEQSKGGVKYAVLFLIHMWGIEFFMPEYHTDLDFSKTLLESKDAIDIIPLSIKWRQDITLSAKDVRVINIPWNIIKREAHDRGAYLVILKAQGPVTFEAGALGEISIKPGYYIYIGSALKNLSKRINRHKKISKKKHWHIDYLREKTEFHIALPIRNSGDIECLLAEALKEQTENITPGFGTSDCSCHSHLYWTKTNPLHSQCFHDILQYFRMDRVVEGI